MRGRNGRLIVVLALMAGMMFVFPSPASSDPASTGLWSDPIAENALFATRPPQTVDESLQYPPAVSTVVLPDGRVLYWGGLEGLEDSAGPLALDAGRSARLSRSRLLDLRFADPQWSTPEPETGGGDDLFCADQRLSWNGKVIAAGGTIYKSDPVDLTPFVGPDGPGGTAELFGSKHTRVFNPLDNTWSVANPMNHGRWYPTLVTLPDGRLLVASGVERLVYNTAGTNVHQTEIYDPITGTWTDNGSSGALSLPLFARLHLLPDGKVFYDGSGQMYSPAGQSIDEAIWNLQWAYDPVSNSWTNTGTGAFGARSGTLSVMLPLEPPYDRARILVAGGTLGTSPGSYVANNLAEIVTVKDGVSTSERVADLNNRRWYSSGVLLPDGTVLALSGGDKDEVIAPGTEEAVRQAELFDGTNWIPLSSAARDRTYHNSAVLLADGRVLVGGHSPINALYGDKGQPPTAGLANNLKDPSFEIFSPPYLFRGERPSIKSVPASVSWSANFAVETDQAENIQKVVLVRLPSTTHVTDADMRSVELEFSATSSAALTAKAPPNGKVAPPGFYYLFLLQDNGQGPTPSVAKVVRIGP